MNKNTYHYSNKFPLFLFMYHISYWLFYIVVIILLFNILNYDSYVVYCDSNEPINQFFVDDSSNESLLDSDSNNDTRYSNIWDKYKNIGRRKIAWYVFEKDKGNFSSYKEYKKHWDPHTKILSEIKKQIKLDIDKTSLPLHMRTLRWFISKSKPGGGRGL
jgi:hypothetical protein